MRLMLRMSRNKGFPMRGCQCVFPNESEQEWVTVQGTEPGTALRVYLQAGPGGYVRLQQLAHDPGLGWYVQKSMVLEREVLESLLPQLRRGLCLMPKQQKQPDPVPFMRLVPRDAEPATRTG